MAINSLARPNMGQRRADKRKALPVLTRFLLQRGKRRIYIRLLQGPTSVPYAWRPDDYVRAMVRECADAINERYRVLKVDFPPRWGGLQGAANANTNGQRARPATGPLVPTIVIDAHGVPLGQARRQMLEFVWQHVIELETKFRLWDQYGSEHISTHLCLATMAWATSEQDHFLRAMEQITPEVTA